MNDNFEKNIRKTLADRERKASEGLLDDVKAEMSRRNMVVSPFRGSRRTSPLMILMLSPVARRVAVAAAVAAILIVPMVLQHGNSPEQYEQAATKMERKAAERLTETTVAPSPLMAGNVPKRATRQSVSSVARQPSSIEAALESDETYPENTEEVSDDGEMPEQKADEQRNSLKQMPSRHDAYYRQAKKARSATSRGKGVTLGLYYSGMATNNVGLDAGDALYASTADAAPVQSTNYSTGSAFHKAMAAAVPETTADHHVPLKMGLGLRFRLSNRWNVGTGLNYSYLSSDFTTTFSGETIGKAEQKLHYVGVLVKFGYDIYNYKGLNVYATAGGEVEKLVNGTSVSHEIDDGEIVGTEENSVSENPLQFSANLSAGIEYEIAKSGVTIYAEPGVSYYFDNGSDVVNIYKDKQLNFSLSLGVRFTVK